MKQLVAVLAAVAVLVTGRAFAQDLAGQWQGALKPPQGKELRIVLRITKADAGWQGTFHSIDQGGQGIAAAITVQGGTVTAAIPAINGGFEGKLSADGTTLIGTFTQGGSLPLALTRATGSAAWDLPAAPAALKPMAAGVTPKVDVSTVKPSRPDTPGKLFTFRGRAMATVNTTVIDLMMFAYGVQARQIIGAPAWAESEKYDLSVQPDAEGVPNTEQMRALMRSLLADRFHLTFHNEQRELPVYAITVGKDGPKLTKSAGDPNGLPSLLFRGLGVLPGLNASMSDLAGVLQSAVLDRPVVDQTKLAGKYDFTITWTPDETQFAGMGVRVPPPSNDPNAPPTLFTAFQEQLGLKLESTRAPVNTLIVDRLDKPSEN